MRVLVTGGTGLVGRPACDALRAAGHAVTIVSREPGRVPARAIGWDGLRAAMPETDAIVNLAGESVAGGRWTAARKAAIRSSRVEATRALVDAAAAASPRPTVLVNASAVGYYGPHGGGGVRFPGARLRRVGGRGTARRGARVAGRRAPPGRRARAGRRRAVGHAPAVPCRARRSDRRRPAVDVVGAPRRRRRPAA